MNNSADLLAGVDSIRLDTRNLKITKKDIEKICNAFQLGKIKNYEKERNIAVSHSNFFIFLSTKQGEYAIKLYPANEGKFVTTELILNRLLIKHHFPSPSMHVTRTQAAFLPINKNLATCFDFIDGSPIYQRKLNTQTITRINKRILHLKTILNPAALPTNLITTENLSQRINTLIKEAKQFNTLTDQKLIESSLIKTYKLFIDKHKLFIPKPIHNNISLSNLFWYKNKVYILDLSHIKIDYEISDLASLVISCLFMDKAYTAIRDIIQNYFDIHQMNFNNLSVLTSLLTIGLVKEYVKTVRREQKIPLLACPTGLPIGLPISDNTTELSTIYSLQLVKRKTLLAHLLRTLQSKARMPFYP